MKFRCFIIFFCAYASIWAQSTGLYHETFTKQDGLQLDKISAMALDNDGFLWLGGENLDVRKIVMSDKKLVIQRFNGRTFQNIVLPEFNGALLEVDQFYKRNDGKFYVHAKSQQHVLYLFDPFTLEFTKPDFITEESTAFSHVFFYDGKEYLLSQQEQQITLNILHLDLSLEPVFSFTNEEDKFLLDSSTTFIGNQDFCIIGDDNFPITTIAWDGTILDKASNASFSRDRIANQNKFWITGQFQTKGSQFTFIDGESQLYQIKKGSYELQPVEEGNLMGSHNMAVSDPSGNHLLVSQEAGNLVFRTYEEAQGFEKLHDLNVFEAYPGLSLFSNHLKKDLWIGTSTGELHYFKFPSDKIKTYIPNTSVRSIAALSDSTYIIATEGIGWFRLNVPNETMEHLDITENAIPLKPYSSRNIFVEGDTIWSNDGGNIIEVSRATMKAEAYRHFPVTCMEKATDSTFIYGTHGYNLMEFHKNTKIHQPLVKTDTLEFYDIEIQNDLLVGATNKGVLTYDLISKAIDFYPVSEVVTDSFMLMVDYHPDYGYLLGTRSGTILSFDSGSKTFEIIYEDALQAGIATILFEDETWWINTFNGIVAFNSADGSSIRFSEKDGFSNSEANRYSALDTGNGLLIGTIAGLNYFKPDELIPPTSNSELVALAIRSYDAEAKKFTTQMNRENLQNTKIISLPAEHKELYLEFGLTHNVDNREHHYRYRLDQDPWIDIDEEQSIRFPNLSSGNYNLEIEALDFSGNKIGASLAFEIDSKSFFYRTWWFYLLLTFAVVSLSFYFLKQALDKRKMHEKFSEALIFSQELERTRIAKELHDSVGQQLTLIKRKSQMASMDEITCLTNSALEEVRSISRGLYPTVLKQLGLTESIKQLVHDVDVGTSVFITSELDDIDSYFAEQESLNFYRFIQESLANILTHAEATSAEIKIKKIGQKIVVLIKDNGVGFDPIQAKRKPSLGLKTVAERIRILKGTFQLSSKVGQGTSIQSEIPIK